MARARRLAPHHPPCGSVIVHTRASVSAPFIGCAGMYFSHNATTLVRPSPTVMAELLKCAELEVTEAKHGMGNIQ